MKRRPWGRILACTLLGLLPLPGSGTAGDEKRDPEATLYFFTTPEAAGGPDGARRARAFQSKVGSALRLRPVLLVRDWSGLQSLTESSLLTGTLQALLAGRTPGSLDLPLYDEEGLALARLWDLRAVPAFVLVRGGKAHRVTGSASDLEQLWGCRP